MRTGKKTKERYSKEQYICPGQRNTRLFHINVGSCNGCDIEVYALSMFGYEFVNDLTVADVILACGAVTKPMSPILEQTLNKTQNTPVIAVGTCAISGIVFGGDKVLGPVDKFTPTEVYVFGCPPRPKEIMQGISMALKRGGSCYV